MHYTSPTRKADKSRLSSGIYGFCVQDHDEVLQYTQYDCKDGDEEGETEDERRNVEFVE